MSNNDNFFDKLQARVDHVGSYLCVGIDPHPSELQSGGDDEKQAILDFCRRIIQATLPYACCYKPNAAFFEEQHFDVLKQIVEEIHNDSSDSGSTPLVLLDVKRGDIGSTAQAYAKACYDYIGADAVTLSPLMGWDSIAPFVTDKYSHKAAFLLCKTSNPGSNDLLTLQLASNSSETLYERIAKLAGSDNDTWTAPNNLGLVVGATDTDALQRVRKVAPTTWILAPGVGFQGGDLVETITTGSSSTDGKSKRILVPVSRGISRAQDPGQAAKEFRDQINDAMSQADKNTCSSSNDSESSSDIQPFQKEFIEFSLQQNVLKFGSFVLKSGRTSPYFFNAGLFSTGAALHKLGKCYASSIMNSSELSNNKDKVNFDVIFGPAYKGISLAAVVGSALYNDFGVDVGFAYNRKEKKAHGEGGQLVGAPMTDKRILIIDDVITAGTAIRESFDILQEINAKPVGVIIALDRAEIRSSEDRISAVQAVQRDFGIPVVSIVNLPQLQTFLQQQSSQYSAETLESVVNYRKEYGV